MKKTFSKISIDNIKENSYKPQFDQAQLRQVVTTSYPTVKIGNDLFDEEDFNLESTEFESVRIAWVNIPKNKFTVETLGEYFSKNKPNIHLQNEYSYNPIIDADTQYAIDNLGRSIEQVKESQIVKDRDGLPVLHNGLPFYRITHVKQEFVEDIDNRNVKALELNTPAINAVIATL